MLISLISMYFWSTHGGDRSFGADFLKFRYYKCWEYPFETIRWDSSWVFFVWTTRDLNLMALKVLNSQPPSRTFLCDAPVHTTTSRCSTRNILKGVGFWLGAGCKWSMTWPTDSRIKQWWRFWTDSSWVTLSFHECKSWQTYRRDVKYHR